MWPRESHSYISRWILKVVLGGRLAFLVLSFPQFCTLLPSLCTQLTSLLIYMFTYHYSRHYSPSFLHCIPNHNIHIRYLPSLCQHIPTFHLSAVLPLTTFSRSVPPYMPSLLPSLIMLFLPHNNPTFLSTPLIYPLLFPHSYSLPPSLSTHVHSLHIILFTESSSSNLPPYPSFLIYCHNPPPCLT